MKRRCCYENREKLTTAKQMRMDYFFRVACHREKNLRLNFLFSRRPETRTHAPLFELNQQTIPAVYKTRPASPAFVTSFFFSCFLFLFSRPARARANPACEFFFSLSLPSLPLGSNFPPSRRRPDCSRESASFSCPPCIYAKPLTPARPPGI